jgi:polysaccharide export outer membrane protein
MIRKVCSIQWWIACVSLVFLLAAGCSSSPSNRARDPRGVFAEPDTDIAIVQPGDILEIYVLEDESFNGRYQVRSGGHVIFPKVGRVRVAGRTLAESEKAIKAAFETNQLKTATVIVERQSAGPKGEAGVSVYVHGAVGAPGRRTIPWIAGQPPTVYQAVLEAGGFTRWANRRNVVVTREIGGSERITVDLEGVIKRGEPDLPLQNRDIIFVPEKTWGF